MKPINLKSLIIANKGLPQNQRDMLYGIWGVSPKAVELASIECLVASLDALSPLDPKLVTYILDDCFFGFSIPRISKEFDCLWIGENTIVNLELKSKSIAEEKILKQLRRNRYYLRHLSQKIISYTFDASTGKCYTLDSSFKLIDTDIKTLGRTLYEIHKECLLKDGIEALFPPEKYLVSPFNSTIEFLEGRYFLTDHQQTIKENIIHSINNDKKNFYAITGGPGSGKTLLMYDIAKTLADEGKIVVIGHAGALNSGHNYLNENGWCIHSTKNLLRYIYSTGEYKLAIEGDVYFIDESQRTPHVPFIAKEVIRLNKCCVFSFDTEQVMSDREQNQESSKKILDLVGDNCYQLSSNIRTNAAVYEFVNALFDIHHSVNKNVEGHVEITFCQTETEAEQMLEVLKMKGFVVPKFTPMIHSTENYEYWFPADGQSAHQVIGQEFNDVASLVSSNMCYNKAGKLTSKKNYRYREDRMLYQILTRARRKIHLVIVTNPIILERCIRLVEQGKNER